MRKKTRKTVLSVLLLVLMPVLLALGASWIGGRTGQTADTLTADLRRAAVHCYAVEGRYPPDLDYLTEQYGVRYDKNSFYVFYNMISANLMPDITVVQSEEALQ